MQSLTQTLTRSLRNANARFHARVLPSYGEFTSERPVQNTNLDILRPWIATAALIGMLGIAGCASGHSAANLPSAISQAPASSQTAATSQTGGGNLVLPTGAGYTNTGWTGSVGAPAPASFGTSPLPAQLATEGGP